MIALGLIGLLVAYVGLYSGFTGVDPRDEILSAFRGGTPPRKLAEDPSAVSTPGVPSLPDNPRGVSAGVRP